MKKVLSVLVVMCMIVSTLPAAGAHWADEDVKYLIENGAIAEDDAMLENLDTPITRSQMVKVIVALLEGDEPIEGKEYFTDITAEDTHIAKAAENGFVNGFGDGTFRPNNPITRQDFFTIVGRAYKLTGEATSEFADADSVADYAKPYVDALQSIGIVNGYGDGTVNPRGNITIAETLAVMHRTDEHVNANTPKEEEKPTTKPSSGSSGGGGGGGFSGGSSGGALGDTAPETREVTFTVELAEDYSSGVVAYITPSIPDRFASMPKLFARGNKDTCYNSTATGGYISSMDVVTRYNLDIPENNGTYAVPDFGTYSLCLYDSIIRDWRKFEVTVNPPKSEDITPPTLTVEASGENNIPFEIKVSASDDNEIVRLNYVRVDGVASTYEEKARLYKAHPNDRKDITDGSFIAKKTDYAVCAMDASGNCSYAEFKVRYGQPLVVTYSNQSIAEISGGGYRPPPSVRFDVELSDDFSEEFVAQVTTDVIPYLNAPIVKTFLVKNDYLPISWSESYDILSDIGTADFDAKKACEMIESSGQYIIEEDGKFNIPDFGMYALYTFDEYGDWAIFKVNVAPPDTEDVTSPELTLEVPDETTLPLTVTVNAIDDVEIARMRYVKVPNEYAENTTDAKTLFETFINGREAITENSFTIESTGTYAVCVMDINCNCTYAAITVNDLGEVNIS